MDYSKQEYEEELKRMRDQYGPGAEMPKMPRVPTPNVLGGLSPVPAPVVDRIAELAHQVAESARAVQDARQKHAQTVHLKAECEAMYAKLMSKLIETLHELQEGTPEGVPYPR